MFPASPTNGHPRHDGQEHREDRAPTPLQEIVRQETGDGRLIVRFLVSAMQGGLEGSKPCHRLNAARQLLDLGFTDAQHFIDASSPRPSPRRRASPAPSPERNVRSVLCKIVREETDDGRDAVRFLVEVMQGSLEGFKPHHRLAAARELLHRGFDDTHDDGPDPDELPRAPRRTSSQRLRTPVNPYGPRLYVRDTQDGNRAPADDHDSCDSTGDHSSSCPDDAHPTQAVAAELAGDGSLGGDTPAQDQAGRETQEPPSNGPGLDDAPGCSDPEDPDSDNYDPNAGYPLGRDLYYDFADPPNYGEEPEAQPKPDPNALSKWELKAMEKGTLVWDSPGYTSLDSTTPGRH